MCDGPVSAELTALDRNRHLSNETFSYFRCGRCATLQLQPVPSDLGRYYTSEYYAVPPDRESLASGAAAEQYKLEIVRSFAAGGRLVEIGPAVGGFSAIMKDAGYDVSAIEMDADCCRYLRDVLGIETQCTDDPVAGLAAVGSVDVIALWHVIEHLRNPREVLAAAAAALRPGGIIALAAPNPESLQFRLLGSRWAHLDAPRHLVLAPAAAYAQVGEKLGLRPVLFTTRDEGTLRWNDFGWRESLAGVSSDRYVRHALRLAGGLVSRCMAPLDERGSMGATYTLVLRRPA